MQIKTLHRILCGLRDTHKNARISYRRWLNTYIVAMGFPDIEGVVEMTFKDHTYVLGETPLGMLADAIYSLPTQQQLPLLSLLGDVIEHSSQLMMASEKLVTSVQDIRLEMIALRHDNESLKREKTALIKKDGL